MNSKDDFETSEAVAAQAMLPVGFYHLKCVLTPSGMVPGEVT